MARYPLTHDTAPDERALKGYRRLSYVALVLVVAQIVFGAIVRITGSGMGCGDHWPRCLGSWFPPLDRVDLVVEITHRYMAMGLSIAIAALLIVALARRSRPGMSGRGGLLRPAGLATFLVICAALLGAVTVKLGLNPLVIAAHLTIAMSLLAVIAVIAIRSGAFGGSRATGASARTVKSARVALVMAFAVLILGALTANLPGAAASCGGFPWCRSINGGGAGLAVQIVHRVLAFLLIGHLWAVARGAARRNEPGTIVRTARIALALGVTQVLVAGAMVEMSFPPVFRSLHQAIGTLLWLAIVVLTVLASRGAHASSPAMNQRMAA